MHNNDISGGEGMERALGVRLSALRLGLFKVCLIPRGSQEERWCLISVGSLWLVISCRVSPSGLVRIAGEGGGEKRLRML